MSRRKPKEYRERVAIVGSRKYPDMDSVVRYVHGLPRTSIVVSGGAAGVDKEAITAAHERCISVDIYWPDWNKHGKAAGPIRNTEIVNSCDRLVAFWDGSSRGTADSIAKARAAGKPVEVFTCRRPPKGARREAREPDLAWWERNDTALVPVAGGRRRPTKVE